MNPEKTSMKGRRLDWLFYTLITSVAGYYLHKQLEKRSYFKRNLDFEKKVRESVKKAAAILDSHVTLPEEQGAAAAVCSASNPSTSYTVTGPGTASVHCTCAYSERGNLCKHAVKVRSIKSVSLLQSSQLLQPAKNGGNKSRSTRHSCYACRWHS